MKLLISLAFSFFSLTCASFAQDIQEQRVQFATGAIGTSLSGAIKGDEIQDYVLGAKAGQRLVVAMSADNASANFNILPANDPEAIHIGSISGNSYDGMLKRDGDYRIRVYLVRAAARRDEVANYDISIEITGAGAQVVRDDFADGLSGGPDFWQVSNLSGNGTLNLRSSAGTQSDILARLQSGDRLENEGCKLVGDDKWCSVKTSSGLAGWVSGDYLVEAMAPGSDTASGMIPCAMETSQPFGQCEFRVSRGSGGTASVWVTLPSGGERYFDFREGELVGSDPNLTFRQERTGDLNSILINEKERYEMPDALIFGG